MGANLPVAPTPGTPAAPDWGGGGKRPGQPARRGAGARHAGQPSGRTDRRGHGAASSTGR